MMIVWLYSWFDFISTRESVIDVFVFVSYSLGVGLVRCNTSAVHLHSFRFAGGILTAAPPPFSQHVGFITLSIGLISYRRENGLWRCMSLINWLDFISTRELFFDVLVFESYSLDMAMSVAWFGLLHPPSIFTLFASPVAFLRPAIGRLSLRMLVL